MNLQSIIKNKFKVISNIVNTFVNNTREINVLKINTLIALCMIFIRSIFIFFIPLSHSSVNPKKLSLFILTHHKL